MGFDSTNYLPPGAKAADVGELLRLLRFKPWTAKSFLFAPDDYNYLTGVHVTISQTWGRLRVHTHTSIWAQKADTDLQNQTIKQLRGSFGGSFRTDEGDGHFLRATKPVRSGAECGCYIALFHLHNNLSRAHGYLMPVLQKVAEDPNELRRVALVGEYHPTAVATNLLLPFVASIVEQYFKATYVALFKENANKATVVRTINFRAEDLEGVVVGDIAIEQAIVRRLAFQDLSKLARAFAALDRRLDLMAPLKRPFHGRKRSLLESLNAITARRNALIHANVIDPTYIPQSANKDVADIEVALKRVYGYICNTYGWNGSAVLD
jgi:hypothetical protein